MRKLIESTLVSLDGVTEAPEGWANFDPRTACCHWSSWATMTPSSWAA
jgi:hypothetical protein